MVLRRFSEWRSSETGRRVWPWPIVIALGLGLAAGVFSLTSVGFAFEQHLGLAALFRWRGPVEAPQEVVLVAIRRDAGERISTLRDPPADQPCLDLRVDHPPLTHQTLGTVPDRWGRCHYVELLRRLALARPAVTVLDVVFQPRTDRPPAEDRMLARAIRDAGSVVVAQSLRVRKPEQKSEADKARVRSDYLVALSRDIAPAVLGAAPMPLPKGSSNRVDEFWTFKEHGWVTPSLAAVTLHAYAADAYAALHRAVVPLRPLTADDLPSPERLARSAGRLQTQMLVIRRLLLDDEPLAAALRRIADHPQRVPDPQRAALIGLYTGEARRYLNFFGPAGSIRTIDITQLLAIPAETLADDPFGLRGKVVFIGYAEDVEWDDRDNHSTVFDQGADRLSGVEIAATAFSNLLHGSDLKPASAGFGFLVNFLGAASIALLCYALSTFAGIAAAVCIGALYAAAAALAFRHGQHWMPVFVPLAIASPAAVALAFGYKYVELKQDQTTLRRILEQMVPRDVVGLLRENANQLGSEKVKETLKTACVITDVEGYTALSNRLSAAEVSALLAEYFEAIFRPVAQHGGFVSDLKGDSILALWRDRAEDSAVRAQVCRACLDIKAAVERFNAEHPEAQMPTRIGVNYGEVTLGPVGAHGHYEYRPVGDTVNAASRVEQLNKDLGTRLMVTGALADGIEEFLFRPLGQFALRGRRAPTPIHELVVSKKDATDQQIQLCGEFAAALEARSEGRLAEARTRFEEILKAWPGDGPSSYYLGVIGASE